MTANSVRHVREVYRDGFEENRRPERNHLQSRWPEFG